MNFLHSKTSVNSLASARVFIMNYKERIPLYWFEDNGDNCDYRFLKLSDDQKAKLEKLLSDYEEEGLDLWETIETYGDSELKRLILGMNEDDGTYEFSPDTYNSTPNYSYKFKLGLLKSENEPLVFKNYSTILTDKEYEELLSACLDEGEIFHFQNLAAKATELYVKLSDHFPRIGDCAGDRYDHIVFCTEAMEDAKEIMSLQDPEGIHDGAARHAFWSAVLREKIKMFLLHDITLEEFIKSLRTSPLEDEYDDVHCQIAMSAEEQYRNGDISLEEAIENMFQGLLVI